MALPNLFIPGAPKSGTTYLGAVLGQHPDIYVYEKKECKFFSRFKADEPIQPINLLQYELNCFNGYAGQKYIGDFDPGYMYMAKHPRCIPEAVGEGAKAIVILRSPARRAFSEYHHGHRAIGIDKAFADYLVPGHVVYDRSHYADAVKRVLEAFGRERCLVLIFEKVMTEHISFLGHTLWEFLQLPPIAVDPKVLKQNKTSSNQLSIENLAKRTDPATFRKLSHNIEPTYVSFWGEKVHAIHRGVSGKNAEFLDRLKDTITTKLGKDEEKELNRTLFRDEIRRTEDVIGQGLDLWL